MHRYSCCQFALVPPRLPLCPSYAHAICQGSGGGTKSDSAFSFSYHSCGVDEEADPILSLWMMMASIRRTSQTKRHLAKFSLRPPPSVPREQESPRRGAQEHGGQASALQERVRQIAHNGTWQVMALRPCRGSCVEGQDWTSTVGLGGYVWWSSPEIARDV